MLILQRKEGESIVINENIHLSVLDIGTDWVKLSIDAPKEVPILRSELLEAADANREASSITKDSILTIKNFLKKED
ncbi:MAG: carbon storage regulator [Lachnospiraceae bacterium]